LLFILLNYFTNKISTAKLFVQESGSELIIFWLKLNKVNMKIIIFLIFFLINNKNLINCLNIKHKAYLIDNFISNLKEDYNGETALTSDIKNEIDYKINLFNNNLNRNNFLTNNKVKRDVTSDKGKSLNNVVDSH